MTFIRLMAMAICVTAASPAVTDAAVAQRVRAVTVAQPVGIREGRGYMSGMGVTASATSDGLIEIVVAADMTHLDYRSREPLVVRGFFPPAAVTEWLAVVDTMRAAVAGTIPFGRLTRTLAIMADGDAINLFANATENQGQRHIALTVNGCRGIGARIGGVDEQELPRLVASLTAAVAEAEGVPNAPIATGLDSRVHYEHAVGCAARPYVSNPPPRYPAVPRGERRRREVLTQFIIDPNGLVEPSSVAFASDVDPRFAVAARAALVQWRFTKPTRRGRPVRQLAHHALVFEPPVGDTMHAGCSMAGGSGVEVRPVSAAGKET